MKRRRRFGLRPRITIAFVGGALGVSALVAGSTYLLADRYLYRQRIDDSIRQSYGSMRVAIQYLDQAPEAPESATQDQPSDVVVSELIDILARGGTFEALILREEQPFSSSFSFTPALVPPDLAAVVSRGEVGYAFQDQPRTLVFGSEIPGHGLEAYFFYPLSDVDQTLLILRNVLLAVSGIAVILSAAIGTRVSRRVTVPVRLVSDAARRVAEGLLETRLPVAGRDELGRLAHSFNEMAAALEERIGRERQFVGDVSHELRTPLTTLRTSTDYLLNHTADLSPELRRATELLAEDLAYLQRLVDDLLEISRAESGRSDMAWEPVNLAELAREVVNRRTRTEGQVVRILVNADPATLVLRADKKRLERVVGNLLENALVHGRGREVTVRVARGDGEVALSVEDEGPGIPREAIPRIFERFYKADPARQRDDSGGSGLGLAIARENAHLHGGDIEVESGQGRGSRFIVRLPVDGANA